MYIPKSVTKPRGKSSPGASAPKEPNVTIVRAEDILSFPERNQGGVLLEGSIVMKPNAYMFQVYMTPSTITASFATDGEEDAEQFTHTFVGEHPGDELEIAEFIQNNTGRDLLIIYGSCTEKIRKVMGSKCAPMKLKTEGQDNRDGRKKIMTFEQIVATGFVPAHYEGELVLEEPATADTLALDITPESLIQKLPAASASPSDITIASITAAHGSVVTLIGGGGTETAILTSDTDVILKDGANWNALEGAIIHFKVYDGDTKMLIESARE